MVNISIHEPKIKEVSRWTHKDGTVYYVLRMVDDTGSEIDLYINDIDLFTTEIETTILAKLVEHESMY